MDNMDKQKRQTMLLEESSVCGNVRKEYEERRAMDPDVAQPIDSLTAECGSFLTLICC